MARTFGAALVELRGGLVEQRVHCEGQVELLHVQRLEAGLQRARGVRPAPCRPFPPASLLAILVGALCRPTTRCMVPALGVVGVLEGQT